MPRRSRTDATSKLRELESELAHERRVSSALREVGLALGTTLDLEALLELILDRITVALEADRATLYLLDDVRRELVSRVAMGDTVQAIRLRMGEGIAGSVAETGKTARVRDAYKDPRFNPQWDALTGYRTRTILAVPMKNHLGRTIGVVQVLNKNGGDFTDTDAVVLAALATQAAISIDNSRLFSSVTQKNMQLLETKEQLEHRIRDLKLLFDLESTMGRASNMEELMQGVLAEALRVCEAHAASLALRDRTGTELQLHLVDVGHRRMRRYGVPLGQGFVGATISEGEVVHTSEATTDPRRDEMLEDVLGYPCTSVLSVPIEGEDGAPLGAIALYNKIESEGFSNEDRALLLLIAANASTAIRLQQSRESREREERLTTIGRLLSGVMHDLKTPLSVISGYVQLLKQEGDRHKREEFAELALSQFDRIVAMQRDILEFARGDKSLLVRKVFLHIFFEQIRSELETSLAKGGVELVMDLDEKGAARFDESKIARVIHNLARNAQEAMGDKGGTFTIRVFKDSHGALIMTFSDTGPGIPKEIEHRLFESFVTSGKKGGTGLGLAITKRIAEEHGGSINVKSSSRGATFRLRLPQ